MSECQWQANANGYALSGELTRDSVPSVWVDIQGWTPTQSECEVSLEQTHRIDSAGMAMLIHLIQHAKNSNCHIMLSFVPEQLRTLFQLSNIETMLVNHIKK
ncbi:lipid asymmetry maintenance protein MlaB [Vibrio sp. DW001]|uniref:STAS domain-containing protein n=1 Tax=Vibrio sp. DW001 TaxID=2912315 RepID=UPI0023AFEA4B|nr:lipid asymmetry maintenance protein MlaB [Vibrio sp. DW001]WED26364.1 lipid asymmetry maintenance protein MlaB [Vibrio sp. DW001]